MKSPSQTRQESFALSLPPVLLLGAMTTALFYGLIIWGPLGNELLRRYCLNHPVAVACVSLFFVGCVSLVLKYYQVLMQNSLTAKTAGIVKRLMVEGEDVAISSRAEWLVANWQSVPNRVRTSWLGTRLLRVVDLQVSRGRGHQLESDLQAAAETDADRQHDSYSLLRIINWAMPMLGFLGTVLGISQTLGQLDTQKLATQQQEAMNELTAGLYVAFDTTATALILTVCLMFLQFAISRIEIKLLAFIDQAANRELIEYLASDPYEAEETLLTPVREMADGLIASVKELVEVQASIWSRSMAESQQQWSTWTHKAAEALDAEVADKVAVALQEHVSELRQLHEEAGRQVDQRWQQWQTTLSDQARVIQGQQKEIIRQSDTLEKLVGSIADLRKLEDEIHDSIGRLENIGRLEDASVCVGEAVAVLATSLERAGVIRGAAVRPRSAKSSGNAAPSPNSEDVISIEQQRKAA